MSTRTTNAFRKYSEFSNAVRTQRRVPAADLWTIPLMANQPQRRATKIFAEKRRKLEKYSLVVSILWIESITWFAVSCFHVSQLIQWKRNEVLNSTTLISPMFRKPRRAGPNRSSTLDSSHEGKLSLEFSRRSLYLLLWSSNESSIFGSV